MIGCPGNPKGLKFNRILLIMQPEQRINRLEFGRLKSVLFGFSAGVAAKGVVFKRFVF